MAYIYQIKNLKNDKKYVGLTYRSIEQRFIEHCRAKDNFPIHLAIQKYGKENFNISLLEEIDKPEERERYWIEQLGTFKNGYNATCGGDGKPYLDYDLIVATYNKVGNTTVTARLCNCSINSVRNILKSRNVNIISTQDISRLNNSQIIFMFDKETGEMLRSFPSISEAMRFLVNNKITQSTSSGVKSHITDVCKGKRKSAYGYVWKYDS